VFVEREHCGPRGACHVLHRGERRSEDRFHVLRLGCRFGEAVELLGPLTGSDRLLKEPRVLDRRGCTIGELFQQAQVFLRVALTGTHACGSHLTHQVPSDLER
jgi:hypothetical protein